MVRGFSRFVPFLFLGLLRAPTRPERVRDTIWTFPGKKWETPLAFLKGNAPWVAPACADCPGFLVLGSAPAPASTRAKTGRTAHVFTAQGGHTPRFALPIADPRNR